MMQISGAIKNAICLSFGIFLLALPALAGSISGRVTNDSAVGIALIHVKVYDLAGNQKSANYTDNAGYYSMSGLIPGSYKIYFNNWLTYLNYNSEWYNDKNSLDTADPVAVTAGAIITGINAQLTTGGQISGKVTNTSGLGIGNVRVHAYDLANHDLGEATTDNSGNYLYSGLPSGSYKVYFFNNNPNYLSEWYNDKGSFAAADPVTVTAGNVVADIDAQMAASGKISGKVTDASGAGILDILVNVYDSTNTLVCQSRTDADGNYSAGALSSGSFRINFLTWYVQLNLLSEWYNDKSSFETADPIAVIAGSVSANINVQLATGGQISGRVTDTSSVGLRDIRVYAFFANSPLLISSAFSDSNGNYTLRKLVSGSYKVEFVSNGYAYNSEWYNDKTSFSTADALAVTAGSTTPDINAELASETVSTPAAPAGPATGFISTSYSFTTGGAISSIGDPVQYLFDWGDGSDSGWRAVGTTGAAHSWPTVGTYSIRVKARCNSHTTIESPWSPPLAITISDEFLTVTSPDPEAGEQWERARTYAIAWLKHGTQNANVKITLYNGASTLVSTISASTANDGDFAWKVPASIAVGTYFIRVKTIGSPIFADSGVFSIIVPSITVTAPTKSNVWVKNATKTITWHRTGTQDANVKIQLFKDTIKKLDITLSTPNIGFFVWTIPASLANGTYTIKVITLDGKVTGVSKVFAVAAGMIKVTAPSTGARWFRGMLWDISWISEGSVNANVRIDLFKGTIKVLTISSGTPTAAGIKSWNIPSTMASATDYKVRVTTVDNLVKADSGKFTIAQTAGLTLTSPNGNEILKPIETQAIRWTQDPGVLEVKLEFSRDNGGTYVTIADHVPNTGSYDWLVPVNFTRNGMVRVSDASGQPWLNDGLLEFSFKFNYVGDSDEPEAFIWFGGSDPKDPGYEFGKIGIGRTQVQFGGFSKAIDPLAGDWHELRVRFDFRRDSAEIKLDEQLLFENAPLGTTREHYFQPFLVLQTGGEKALDFTLDDLGINVMRLDEVGADKERFNVLTDNFDRYDGQSNALKTCWQWLDPADKKSSVELGPNGEAGNALRMRTEAARQMLIFLPFSLPDKVPFDISDKCFNIEN